MEIANILLALGGDQGNTIPKYDVTPGEIAVLRSIHDNEAVFDVEPRGAIVRTSREELQRLKFAYGGAKDSDNKSIVESLYPGVAARVFETLEELDLPDIFYKATGRMTAKSGKKTGDTPALVPQPVVPPGGPSVVRTAAPVLPLLNPATGKKWGPKARKEALAALAAATPAVAPPANLDDETDDMDDPVAQAARDAEASKTVFA